MFILINKSSGPTSHDIIDELRKVTGIKKIGHAGTLDPLANGVLIVAVGKEATKKISQFVKLDKKYVATLHLGAISDTHDRMGSKKLPARPACTHLSRARLPRAVGQAGKAGGEGRRGSKK
jgi:tRNA pseudouridine(55) synthase